jgi:hypothetical protein
MAEIDETDELHLLADLHGSFCQLNHGPETKQEDYPAVDYIVTPVGKMRDGESGELSESKITIPICQECADALLEDEWTLLYCFDCMNSRWVCRELSRMHYRHHILWLRGCPDCGGKFGGLYFNDGE